MEAASDQMCWAPGVLELEAEVMSKDQHVGMRNAEAVAVYEAEAGGEAGL